MIEFVFSKVVDRQCATFLGQVVCAQQTLPRVRSWRVSEMFRTAIWLWEGF